MDITLLFKMAISLFGKRVVIIEDGDDNNSISDCKNCCFYKNFCDNEPGEGSHTLLCEDEYGEYHRHFQEVGTTIES